MKVLIVGGTSSVAIALKKRLLKNNTVITAGRKNCDITIDLNDINQNISFPSDIDIVIHAAASFGGKTQEDFSEAEIVNVLGTQRVCEAASKAEAKHFILISSIFSLIDKESNYYSIYVLTKKQSEEIAEYFCNSFSLPLTILRPSQIYGNISNFNIRQPFLNHIIEKALIGEEVSIFGKNDAKINVIHVNDLVRIIELVMNKKITGTYACMYPENISYAQFAKESFSAFNQIANIKFLEDKADINDNIFEIDNSLFEKINFYPQINLKEGIEDIAKHRKSVI